MQRSAIDDVLDEMDRLHLALRGGRLDGLAGSAATLEAGIAALSTAGPGVLDEIRRKALRNAACLDAAGRGVRAARRRLAEIGRMDQGLVTYDTHGRRDAATLPTGVLTQRL